MEFAPTIIAFFIGIVASFYGTSAGGGGLLTGPALIFLGLSPQQSIAANVFGYLGLNVAAIPQFHKAKKINYRIAIPATVIGVAGAFVGAMYLDNIPADMLKKIMGISILVVLAIVLLKNNHGIKAQKTSPSLKAIGYVICFFLGAYTVTIVGGASILITYVFIYLFGETFLGSAGTRKIFFLVIDILISIVYAAKSLIVWPFALALFFGTAVGGYFGTHYALKKGEKWVKWIFAVVVVASAIKLIA